jgi:hypothetical protein
LTRGRSDWLDWQRYYLDRPQAYPASGECQESVEKQSSQTANTYSQFSGIFRRLGEQDWTLTLTSPASLAGQTWQLVTLDSETDRFLQSCETEKPLTVWGRLNLAGAWLLSVSVELKS